MASDGPDLFPARPRISESRTRQRRASGETVRYERFRLTTGTCESTSDQNPNREGQEEAERQARKRGRRRHRSGSRTESKGRSSWATDWARRANSIGPAARIQTLGSVLAPGLQSFTVGRFASVPHGGVLDQGGRRWRRRRSPFFKTFLGSQCSGGPRRVCCGFSARPGH